MGGQWRFMDFYGSPYACYRTDSWNFLCELEVNNNSPWCVCRDFNKIMYNSEKRGALLRDEKRMELFREVLMENGLIDLGYYNPWFT